MATHRLVRILSLLALGMLVTLSATYQSALAYSSLFNSRCASCHNDDTTTCVGCHRHRGALHATADMTEYQPGEAVTVTLTGGGLGGWLRGLLYDHHNIELDRATGPTGTGDDGLGNPVTYPVSLQATAPMEAGDYVWEAAWYGGNSSGTGHLEVRAPVTIRVVTSTAVAEGVFPTTWGRIKATFE